MKAGTDAVLVVATCPPPAGEVFEGTLLSDDRTPIGTRLVLQADGRYLLLRTYAGTANRDSALTVTGRWQLEGTQLQLVPHTSGDVRRFVRLPNGDLRVVDRRHPVFALAVLRRRGECGDPAAPSAPQSPSANVFPARTIDDIHADMVSSII